MVNILISDRVENIFNRNYFLDLEDIIPYKLNPYISQWYKISIEHEYQEKTYQKDKNKSKLEKVTFNRKQTRYSLYPNTTAENQTFRI